MTILTELQKFPVADPKTRRLLEQWLENNPSSAIREDYDPTRPGQFVPITRLRLDRTVVVQFRDADAYEKVGLLGATAGIRRMGGKGSELFAVDIERLVTQMRNDYFTRRILPDILKHRKNIKIVDVLGLMTVGPADSAVIRIRPGKQEAVAAAKAMRKAGYRLVPYGVGDDYRFHVTKARTSGLSIAREVVEEAAFRIEFAQPDLVFKRSNEEALTLRIEELASADYRPFKDRNDVWMKEIHLPKAWKIVDGALGRSWHQDGADGPGVAVLDAVLDLSHPALWHVYRGGADFTGGTQESYDDQIRRYRHGTSCAGLIAGFDPSSGFRGVAAGCGVYSARVCAGASSQTLSPDETKTYKFAPTDYNIDGMVEAIYSCLFYEDDYFGKVDIVSLSMEVGGWSPGDERYAELAEALTELAKYGRGGRGCVVVVAAGNDNGNQTVRFPAALDSVISVASANRKGILLTPETCAKLVDGSGTDWACEEQCTAEVPCPVGGPRGYPGSCHLPPEQVTLAAPGLNLWSADSSDDGDISAGSTVGNYAEFGATSGAAPIVAGVAALMLAVNPSLHAEQVKELLRKASKVPMRTCRRTTPPDMRNMGFGFLDAAAAVELALKEKGHPELKTYPRAKMQAIFKRYGWTKPPLPPPAT